MEFRQSEEKIEHTFYNISEYSLPNIPRFMVCNLANFNLNNMYTLYFC
jgi:hypothetical protein